MGTRSSARRYRARGDRLSLTARSPPCKIPMSGGPPPCPARMSTDHRASQDHRYRDPDWLEGFCRVWRLEWGIAAVLGRDS